MRAVIYCRVSTSEQAQNLSLPTQERLCREYCERQGFEVAEVFIERGESAKTIQRPEFLKLIAFCQKRRVHAVVVHSLSRFSRNAADHHTVRGLLAGFGVSLHSVTERIDDSPVGRLVETVLAGVNQFDNDVKTQRTVAGMQEALSRGRWVWRAPLGYVNSRNRLAPSLVPDPDVAPLIRQAFELYADIGRDRRGLLQTLEALGLKSRGGEALTAQSLHNLLRNPVYAGRIRSSLGDERRGDFEPVVAEDLFERVQLYLSGKRGRPEGRHRDNPAFPLRRFVRCGVCGTAMTGSSPRGRTKHYSYYSCRKRCPGMTVQKGILEGQFFELLESLQPKAEYLTLFRAVVLDCWNAELKAAHDVVTRLDSRVASLEQRIREFHTAFVIDRSIDQDAYNEMVGRLRSELTVAKLERSEAQIEATDVEGILAFAEHVIGNAASLWLNASVTDRVVLQGAFFPDGLEWDGAGFGTAVTCLAFKQLKNVEGVEVPFLREG